MAPVSPLAPVQRAIYTVLANDATLVGLLARASNGGPGICDQPEPNARFPRVELGAWSALPSNMMGPYTSAKWGWQVSGQVKALSTAPGELEGQTIVGHLVRLLHFPPSRLAVGGYADVECWVTIEPSYPEVVNNVIVRHFPVIVRVDLHES